MRIRVLLSKSSGNFQSSCWLFSYTGSHCDQIFEITCGIFRKLRPTHLYGRTRRAKGGAYLLSQAILNQGKHAVSTRPVASCHLQSLATDVLLSERSVSDQRGLADILSGLKGPRAQAASPSCNLPCNLPRRMRQFGKIRRYGDPLSMIS
ncbi:hypothetical protein BDZ97DRAFT_1212971 [Flammula alnicola]|nr:hypothetical protein BDZ97DRAFT_1212971 [Flammula alnicola]